MNTLVRVLRSLAAIMVGYFLMVVLITLVQVSWFGWVSLQRSSLGVLLVAGGLTFVAAALGGFVAGVIAGKNPLAHGLIMSGVVVAETTTLIVKNRVEGPLWFDLTAAGSLIVGIMLGAMLDGFRRGLWRRPGLSSTGA